MFAPSLNESISAPFVETKGVAFTCTVKPFLALVETFSLCPAYLEFVTPG